MTAEESKSNFLWKNLARGLIWFTILIAAFIFTEDYLRSNFKPYIESIQTNQFLLFGTFTLSEIIFGIIPPEFFMMISILHDISGRGYIINLVIYTILSYLSGILGYFIGKRFSKAKIYQRLHEKYLNQYEAKLKTFGAYLVFVGAVTPIPFSAMCMMAGSVNLSLSIFLFVITFRVLRFAVYGWMVWHLPNWFGA